MVELPFSVIKALRNVALTIKTSSMFGNRTQYANHQMNNKVKNHICPKKSQYHKSQSLWTDWLIRLYETIASLSPRLV